MDGVALEMVVKRTMPAIEALERVSGCEQFYRKETYKTPSAVNIMTDSLMRDCTWILRATRPT